MYAVIEVDGQQEAIYTLTEWDLLDCDIYAQRYAEQIGYALIPSGMPGNVCSADVYVILQEEPGSVVCWNSASYFYQD